MGNVSFDLSNTNTKEIEHDQLIKMAKELFRQNDNIVLENTIGNYLIFSNLYMQKKLLFKIRNSLSWFWINLEE